MMPSGARRPDSNRHALYGTEGPWQETWSWGIEGTLRGCRFRRSGQTPWSTLRAASDLHPNRVTLQVAADWQWRVVRFPASARQERSANVQKICLSAMDALL